MTAILQAAGTMFTASGQAQAGRQQQQAYDINAQQEEIQGAQQRNISITEAQQKERQATLRAGSIRAAYGAAGVDPNSGSPLAVMADQATQGELTKHLTLWQGMAQQQSADTQAGIDRLQGRAARAAGYSSAAGTLFSGFGQILAQSGQVGTGIPKSWGG